ncbi:MAG: ATP-dependent DNA helicase RecG [Peptoniphilaceae bacterium]|nr:ATP-dependent DNA helicase RecG [Peptoniphilaceae bacterium]MDY3076057.1 ATP-dependent DNA helicase RecG [Peptoniphilaceae bacterium]
MQIEALRGVGPKKKAILEKLGIHSAEDLLLQVPRRYEDRSRKMCMDALEDGETVLVRGKLTSLHRILYLPGKRTLQRAVFSDETGSINVVWHNQRYLARNLRIGDSFYLYGTYSEKENQIADPKMQRESEDMSDFLGILPVYPLTDGINNRFRVDITRRALEEVSLSELEILPDSFLRRHDFTPIEKLLHSIHFPESWEALEKATMEMRVREQIVELFAMRQLRIDAFKKCGPSMKKVDIAPFLKRIPFSLTKMQKDALTEIRKDLYSDIPMNRLLLGDVGSGKTVLAFALAYEAVCNGFQVAMMAPTEVLAVQHYDKARSIFRALDIPVYLSTGADSAERRSAVLSAAASGQPGIFIGTHALFSESFTFLKLGLTITDEQHRFGVSQRAKLEQKAIFPNALVLSATPIPRTLRLVEIGELSVTRIKGLPPGRRPVETAAVSPAGELISIRRMLQEIAEGHQAYLVCPRIEDEEDHWSVVQVERRLRGYLQENRLPYSLGVLTGRHRADEKAAILSAFRQKKIDILIATTVIEVGIDIANATMMLVLAADRFGLAQLHQLRGRVGRGEYPSFCILIASTRSAEALKRLKRFERLHDGLEIAKMDLRDRGAGERWGLRQHGMTDAIDLKKDREAREIAREFLNQYYRSVQSIGELEEPLRSFVKKSYQQMKEITFN